MPQGWAHCESWGPLPLPGCGQDSGSTPGLTPTLGFSTLKGLDAQLCQDNIGPKSLLARAAQKSFCARAAEGFSHNHTGNTLVPLL